jgi:hypothetical protein
MEQTLNRRGLLSSVKALAVILLVAEADLSLLLLVVLVVVVMVAGLLELLILAGAVVDKNLRDHKYRELVALDS